MQEAVEQRRGRLGEFLEEPGPLSSPRWSGKGGGVVGGSRGRRERAGAGAGARHSALRGRRPSQAPSRDGNAGNGPGAGGPRGAG